MNANNKYVDICLEFGITESAMNDYIYENYILIEETQPQNVVDVKYQQYVQRCKSRGIVPLPKTEYIRKRRTTTKLLAGGAAIAGGALALRSKPGMAIQHNLKMKSIARGNERKVIKAKFKKDENKLIRSGKRKVAIAKIFG